MSYLVEVYVPLTYKDGRSIPPAVLGHELHTLAYTFGGATIVPDCTGFWVNPQRQIIQDRVEIWRIVCATYDSIFWTHYKRHACELYGQDEMFLTVTETRIVGEEVN